jgi:hypothetical protein
MPSAQDCAERLREQAYRTLLPQIRDLEQELQNISNSLTTGVHQIGRKLEALSHIELPTTELVLNEILGDVTRDRDLKANALVLFAQDLRQKETQEEILALLLDAAQKYSSRTALFAVRGNQYIGWSSRGYTDAVAREIGTCSFLRSESPKFEEVLEGGNAVIASGFAEGAPLKFLSEEAQRSCCLVPLNVLQHPVAILLAEGTEGEKTNEDELSILAEFTVLRLENIALKILYELSAVKPETGLPVQEETAEAEPAAAPEPPSGAPETAWAVAQEQQAEPVAEPIPEPLAEPVPQSVAEPVPEPAEQPAVSFDLDALKIPEPAVAAEAVTFSELEQTPSFHPATPVEVPPPAPEPEPPKMQAQEIRAVPEQEKLHSDAKRFARLLVSEIKLYNEHHVVEGRENRDLYLRLKRDIDRSREMYEKRVSPNVSRKIDYFHDEIIRILGDNDPSTLGSDYPGPRVES